MKLTDIRQDSIDEQNYGKSKQKGSPHKEALILEILPDMTDALS